MLTPTSAPKWLRRLNHEATWHIAQDPLMLLKNLSCQRHQLRPIKLASLLCSVWGPNAFWAATDIKTITSNPFSFTNLGRSKKRFHFPYGCRYNEVHGAKIWKRKKNRHIISPRKQVISYPKSAYKIAHWSAILVNTRALFCLHPDGWIFNVSTSIQVKAAIYIWTPSASGWINLAQLHQWKE